MLHSVISAPSIQKLDVRGNHFFMSDVQREALRARQRFELNRRNQVDINNIGYYTPPDQPQDKFEFRARVPNNKAQWARLNSCRDIDNYNKDREQPPQITPNTVVPFLQTKRIHKAEFNLKTN